MNASGKLAEAKNRFLATLEIVRRELVVLKYSHGRLFASDIDPSWVEHLETNMDDAEKLEAFVSRFGRTQDTIGDKLIPRALSALAEKTSNVLGNLNRAERLGWLASVDSWLVARDLRNRLVHEYMIDANQFAEDVVSADRQLGSMQPRRRCAFGHIQPQPATGWDAKIWRRVEIRGDITIQVWGVPTTNSVAATLE